MQSCCVVLRAHAWTLPEPSRTLTRSLDNLTRHILTDLQRDILAVAMVAVLNFGSSVAVSRAASAGPFSTVVRWNSGEHTIDSR
jgi:hypothetical protein